MERNLHGSDFETLKILHGCDGPLIVHRQPEIGRPDSQYLQTHLLPLFTSLAQDQLPNASIHYRHPMLWPFENKRKVQYSQRGNESTRNPNRRCLKINTPELQPFGNISLSTQLALGIDLDFHRPIS